MDNKKNPFLTFDKGFSGVVDPLKALGSTPNVSKTDLERRTEQSNLMPYPVALPPHLYIPETGQSVELRRLSNVPNGTTATLIKFTAPKGKLTNFIGYAIFCNALDASTVQFYPKVNGARVFPFHGDPQSNFAINLGLGPDLSNASLIQCQLYMKAGDVLTWTFTNNAGVSVAAGVRMSGYVDSTIVRKNGRFGG